MVFPLPLDFFPPLRISKDEARSFLQWGDSLLQQTIDAYHSEQFDTLEIRERKWKPIKQKRDLTVYRRRKMKNDSEYKYLCTGRIDGTLDEVVMGRYADNTPDFRCISGVYREDIVDCAVLGVIKKRSPEDPFFLSCFKWMTVDSPGKRLIKKRDVCWYEQIGMTRDRNGKEIGYTLTESVELPNCPLFSECVRAKFSVCYLYRHHKSGGVKVYMRGKNDAGGKVVDWVADVKSAELWLRIERARPVAHAVIATALVKAGTNTNSPIAKRGKCDVCQTKVLAILSSLKQCAVCHVSTCLSCVSEVRVLNFHDFRVPLYENFCDKCKRLIHQVDLRAPESVNNFVQYAAASLTGSESLEISPMSSTRSKAPRRYSSPRLLPQPVIGVKSKDPDDEVVAPYAAHSEGSCLVPKHCGQSVLNNVESSSSLIPAQPVTGYDEVLTHTKSDNTDTYRHSYGSASDQWYTLRDSETPLTRPSSADVDPYNYNFDNLTTITSSASSPSTDVVTQFLKMNLKAEQSRQQVQEALKAAHRYSGSSRSSTR